MNDVNHLITQETIQSYFNYTAKHLGSFAVNGSNSLDKFKDCALWKHLNLGNFISDACIMDYKITMTVHIKKENTFEKESFSIEKISVLKKILNSPRNSPELTEYEKKFYRSHIRKYYNCRKNGNSRGTMETLKLLQDYERWRHWDEIQRSVLAGIAHFLPDSNENIKEMYVGEWILNINFANIANFSANSANSAIPFGLLPMVHKWNFYENSPKCKVCNSSNTTVKKIKECSACLTALYCGAECQKMDWPNHKVECKKIQEHIETVKSLD